MVPRLIVPGMLPDTPQVCAGIGQSTLLWDEELSGRVLAQCGGVLTVGFSLWTSLKRPQNTFEDAEYGRS